MCAIAGITGDEIAGNLYDMLISTKHRGPDESGIFVDNEVVYGDLEDIKIRDGSFGMGHNLLSIERYHESQPSVQDNLVLVCDGVIYNHKELKNKFQLTSDIDSNCKIILSLIKKFHRGSLYDAVIKTINYLEGDYAFAVYDGKSFIALRDPVGVKPLYYGRKENVFAFSSKRKALWDIGIDDAKTLSPEFMIHNQKIVKIKGKLSQIMYSGLEKSILPKNILKKQLKDHLIKSVEKRVSGLDRVGILFSGGIDSTILATINKTLGIETTLYTVGHENSIDLKVSKKTAETMDIPLKIKNVDITDVKRYLPMVLDAIEEFNIMKLGVGMPAYIAAEMAHSDGLKVMLSGQGADELFGGYHRYLKSYEDNGELAQEDLKNDILNLYHVNLQRDDAVTMANSVELRVPYLDLDIINTAMNIPMKYKINGKDDNLRKCILREVGAELGVPEKIVNRPKKAAQYGSGIHKMLKKVLKDKNHIDVLNKFDK